MGRFAEYVALYISSSVSRSVDYELRYTATAVGRFADNVALYILGSFGRFVVCGVRYIASEMGRFADSAAVYILNAMGPCAKVYYIIYNMQSANP